MSEVQAIGRRNGAILRDNFAWLIGPYDVYPIAEKLNKPWSEIEDQLIEDLLMRVVRVYYLPDGSSKTYPNAIERHRPKHLLERFFLDDIYERPLAWDWVWASVTRVEEGQIDDHYLLHLEAQVDGVECYSKIRIHIYDLISSGLDQDEFFALAWNDMIKALDHEFKLARYGPRR